MSSELNFTWVQDKSVREEISLFPLPVPGEIARIITEDGSGRDEGGCIAPSVAGLLVILRDDGRYEIRDYSFNSRRGWDPHSSWLERRGEIGSARLSDSLPAFLWQTCKSAYYMHSDDAKAEVEVVFDPTPEWLLAEMAAIGEDMRDSCSSVSPLENAEEMLRQREEMFFEAISEDDPLCKSLCGVWLERSRMDIRALALRWLIRKRIHREIELEFFSDPRPPKWRTDNGSYDELLFQGRVVARVPKRARATWGKNPK